MSAKPTLAELRALKLAEEKARLIEKDKQAASVALLKIQLMLAQRSCK